jgi:membrane peptidoglycan carboxypeptidase
VRIRWGWVVLLSLGCTAALLWFEMRTSRLQSWVFSKYARTLTWEVRDGPCDTPMPAPQGPYDARLGYAHLEALQQQLTARDFRVASQACPAPELLALARRGIAPPYPEKHTGRLQLLDREQKTLYQAPVDKFAFQDWTDIPSLLVRSLLYVENRQLLDERPALNPALEWDRLFFAGANYALDKVVDHGNVQGGSTLATQIEKFRHSPDGRTAGSADKLRQIFAASLRAYRDGPDTRAARRQIVLDYLNSMPLGAATGEGEVTGLGHGMWAWFGKKPEDLVRDLTLTEEDRHLQRKAETYKQTLALVMATRRPTLYLARDHAALEERIQTYLPLLEAEGIVSPRLAAAVRAAALRFRDHVPPREKFTYVDRKATNAVRAELVDLLGLRDLYALDRYDLRVETSIDAGLQSDVTAALRRLGDAGWLARKGFYGKHLLGAGNDPSRVLYSFSLYEASPQGNRLLVSADNLDKPLDINRNVKLELGSTAKLRTMANYLMVIASLHERYAGAPAEALDGALRAALDPVTRWTVGWLRQNPDGTMQEVLEASLQRPFSADPGEGFFTGRGLHYFGNFDDDIKGPTPVRVAFQHSVNLVYIRLMRELVQYYVAELDYDQRAILADLDHPQRKELLDAAMENEARETLASFFNRYRNKTFEEALARMCGKEARGLKRLAIFALADDPAATVAAVRALAHRVYPGTTAAQDSLLRTYHRMFAGKIHNAQDEAYLLGRHPLEVWMVRDRRAHPESRWSGVVERSADARQAASQWIYPRRFKEAQNLRIRIELERRAFVEIHAAWKKLGYPFESLVPSLATAIGSSADRPQALAELVGIIQCEGRRVPFLRVQSLHFAAGTPYETHFEPALGPGEQVMPRPVARALKGLMREVVEKGTARRVQGCLRDAGDRVIEIGGKTGSGDNRVEKFAPDGSVLSSRAINRTASFVFTLGERYFGMVSAYVDGEEAGDYSFTSSLALQAFRAALAPAIEDAVRAGEEAARAETTAPEGTTTAVASAEVPAAGASAALLGAEAAGAPPGVAPPGSGPALKRGNGAVAVAARP